MTTKRAVSFPSHQFSKAIEEGKSLLQAAQENSIPIRSDCGGKGFCGKCLVKVEPRKALTALADTEAELLSTAQIKQGYRLACQAKIKAGVTIHIPSQGAESQEVQGKESLEGSYPVNQSIRRVFLSRADRPNNSKDIFEWLKRRIHNSEVAAVEIKEFQGLKSLSLIEAIENDLTLVLHEERGLMAVLQGHYEKSLGLAIDLGTTTLAAYLCDLKSGQILATAASLNPQRRYGEDVISRIGFCHESPDGLKILHELIIEAINYLILRCLNKVGAFKEEVDALTIVGNTTMGHIFAGLNPSSLGRAPYLPLTRKMPNIKARDLGLDLNPSADVYLFPVVSGFVGGDTLGVVLADNTHLRDEVTLIVDIGTNGEVVLGNRQGLMATSCATGPALEGAQISCGMRAVSGAIHQVSINSGNNVPDYVVLGDDNPLPLGLCGSGVIDAVAAMRKNRIILENGRLQEGLPGVISDKQGVGRRFQIVLKENSATGAEIGITLPDIRQIQLAKSALAAGIELLMKRMAITRLDRTVLTGAFGARFNWRSAVTIGMLPLEVIDSEILCQDNLAGVGSAMALLDKQKKKEAESLINRIGFLELALEPDFAKRFTQLTMFPSLDRLPDMS